VKKGRHHRLLDFSLLNAEQAVLCLSRVDQLGLQDGRPVLAAAFVLLKLRHVRQLACRDTQAIGLRLNQENLRANERLLVPLDRVTQCGGQGLEDAARLLEPLELCPLLIQRFNQ